MVLRRAALPKIARIDMTPMAGVLICLLIIFIVMTPLYGCGISVELPTVSRLWRDVDERQDTANVGLYRERIFLNGRYLDGGIPELDELLRGFVAERTRLPAIVHLKADVSEAYASVSQVMSACRKAGVTDVRLVAEPKFPEPIPWPFLPAR